jgi:hypothetical protein
MKLRKMIKIKDKAIKEYLESIYDEIMAFQRTGHYDLTYINTKKLGCRNIKPWDSNIYWKTPKGIQ